LPERHARSVARLWIRFLGLAADCGLWCLGSMNGSEGGHFRRPRTLAFGFWLASRGLPARLSLLLTAVVAAIGASSAFWLVRHGATTLVVVPSVSVYALTWGAGLSLAAAASARAPYRDGETGVLPFVLARGATIGDYVRGRVGGLVVWVTLGTVGGTLVTIAGTLAAARATEPVLRASLGALVYALSFGATLGPVAMATLGMRNRLHGYLALVLVVVAPELAAPWTERVLLPYGWRELASLPAALDALRSAALAPPDWLQTARALAGLTAVVAVSLVVILAHAARAAERAQP